MLSVRSVLVLLALVAAFLALARLLSRFVAYPGSPVPFIPAALAPGVTLTDVKTADGLTLRGAWVRSGAVDAPVVLFFHGNAESAAQNLPLAGEIAAFGFDVFLAEYRGYGGMSGHPSETGLMEDAEAALAAVRAAGTPPGRLVLAGRSLGTGVAVALAEASPPAVLILVSPYTSFTDLGRRMVGPLAPLLVLDRFDSLSRIRSLPCPVVVIHGTRDETIPFEMGERLARAAPKGRLVTMTGATHNDMPDLGSLMAAEARKALPPSG